MRRRRLQLAGLVAILGLFAVVAAAVAGGGRNVREELTGYEEVPAVSTVARGEFRAAVNEDRIVYELKYTGLEGNVLQAHIHLGQERVNGGISAFLCSNLPDPPPDTPACPGPNSGTVSGQVDPVDVIGPSGQGIAPGEYAELLRAIRSGVTYANVHSQKFPGGEIRAQLEIKHHGRGDD